MDAFDIDPNIDPHILKNNVDRMVSLLYIGLTFCGFITGRVSEAEITFARTLFYKGVLSFTLVSSKVGSWKHTTASPHTSWLPPSLTPLLVAVRRVAMMVHPDLPRGHILPRTVDLSVDVGKVFASVFGISEDSNSGLRWVRQMVTTIKSLAFNKNFDVEDSE